jgi:anti-anti-sigma factor
MDTTQAKTSGIGLLEEPGHSVLQMWGEVDSALRPDASGALARALDRNLPVVIDTSKVDFIDSTGIAFLVQVCTIGRDEGLEVSLVDPPAVVSDVLSMLGVDDLVAHRAPTD